MAEKQSEKLKTRIVKMSSLVEEQVGLILNSIDGEFSELSDDNLINVAKFKKKDDKVRNVCGSIFKSKESTQEEIRWAMAAISISASLKRIGVLANKIAGQLNQVKVKPIFYTQIDFSDIAHLINRMLKVVIDAIIESDIDLIKQVKLLEDRLDDAVKENSEILISVMKEDSLNIEQALIYYSIYKEFERIGDHAYIISNEIYIAAYSNLKNEAE